MEKDCEQKHWQCGQGGTAFEPRFPLYHSWRLLHWANGKCQSVKSHKTDFYQKGTGGRAEN